MLTKSILGLLVVCGIVGGVAFSRTSSPQSVSKSCCSDCTCSPDACAAGDCDSGCCEDKSCCVNGCQGECCGTKEAKATEGCSEGSCCSSKS
ncbi:MAG: hypothetical protein J0M26_12955 [Planctomycetes bacterium]|nr:hypothetical protein [Planctomycetota bacterium]